MRRYERSGDGIKGGGEGLFYPLLNPHLGREGLEVLRIHSLLPSSSNQQHQVVIGASIGMNASHCKGLVGP